VCGRFVVYFRGWVSRRNSRHDDFIGRAFDASIRGELSASIGCVALVKHP